MHEICARLGAKLNLLEILGKFLKLFFRKLLKYIILSYFSKDLTNLAFDICGFGLKTHIFVKLWDNFENFWWKFYRKMEVLFYFYIGNNVTKNKAFGNNTIFLQQIFSVLGGGGGNFPRFPLATPLGCPANF